MSEGDRHPHGFNALLGVRRNMFLLIAKYMYGENVKKLHYLPRYNFVNKNMITLHMYQRKEKKLKLFLCFFIKANKNIHPAITHFDKKSCFTRCKFNSEAVENTQDSSEKFRKTLLLLRSA